MKRKKPVNLELREELVTALEGFKAEVLLEEPSNIFCYLCKKDADALRGLITWTNTNKNSKYKVGTISKLNVKDKVRFTVMLAPDLAESRFNSYPMGAKYDMMNSIFMEDMRNGLAEEANAIIGKEKKDED